MWSPVRTISSLALSASGKGRYDTPSPVSVRSKPSKSRQRQKAAGRYGRQGGQGHKRTLASNSTPGLSRALETTRVVAAKAGVPDYNVGQARLRQEPLGPFVEPKVAGATKHPCVEFDARGF
jgi:hypothetical protein